MLTLAAFSRTVAGMWAPGDPFPTQEPMDRILQHYYNKHRIADAVNPDVIVELGVRAGYSGYAFGLACPNATYLGFDAYDLLPVELTGAKVEYRQHAQTLLAGVYTSSVITTVDIRKLGTVPRADLYHVDAEHSADGTYHNIALVGNASDQSVILVDDAHCARTCEGVVRWWKDNSVYGIFVPDLRGELMLFRDKELMWRVAEQFTDGVRLLGYDQLPHPTDP